MMVKKALIKNGLLFLLAWVVVSCQDDDFTPILPDEQEVPSAKDNLPWPLTQYMDAVNYRPGDDFFMYCNGKYWETASLGEDESIVGLTETEMQEALEERKASVTNPAYDQVKLHEGVEVSNDQLYAFMKPFYEKIDCIQSYEDAFRVAGELRLDGLRYLVGMRIRFEEKALLYIETRESYFTKPMLKAFIGNPHPDDVYQYFVMHESDFADALFSFEYWEEHQEDYDEYQARADEMVKQYLLPVFGVKEEDFHSQYGFMDWFLLSVEELKAYFKLTVLEDFAPFANQQGRDFQYVESSYERAVIYTEELKRYLDGRLLIERYVLPQTKNEVIRMCEEIRDVFCTRINNLPWMSATTKANAIKKVKAVKFFVGYPDQWLVDIPDMSRCTNMMEDMQVLFREQALLYLNAVGVPKWDDAYYFDPRINLLKVNAEYYLESNSVIIYAPYIMPPLYEESMHPAMIYGMLMSVIGHELTHAVDSKGSKYDLEGNENEWWTIQDRMEYETLQQQLVELYNRFAPIPGYPNEHINGEKTLNENIADLGGMEIAHDAFVAYCQRQGFKGEDLDEMERKFFQGYAGYRRSKYGYDLYNIKKNSTHALDKERVNGVLMNMDRWYELYDVQWGDYLYLKPENRIHIW
jgi:predicted metalloendopeptidase